MTGADAPIITVTCNPAIDYTLSTGPLEDEAVTRTDTATFDPGGKGINVANYLDALEIPTVATGLVGGFTGSHLTKELDAAGIPTDFVEIDGTTRINITLSTPESEYKINHDGPAATPGVVDDLVDRIERYAPTQVVIGGSLPPGLTRSVIEDIATAGGWDTVVDVGGATLADLETDFAVCKPNREELQDATGMPTETVDECIEAAAALRQHGFDRVVASLGPDGAILVSAAGSTHVAATDAEVVDTVGAGDALLAGVLCGWARGYDDAAALQFGVDVATHVVGTAGTGAERVAALESGP